MNHILLLEDIPEIRAWLKALIKQVFKRHNDQVHHIPLHRQYSAWAARANVSAVHRADNWLELRWVRVAP